MREQTDLSGRLNNRGKAQRRPETAPSPAACAAVESLEGRRLFAAAPPVAPFVDGDGVLQVAGTRKSDAIVLALHPAADPAADPAGDPAADPAAAEEPAAVMVDVTVNGVTTTVALAAGPAARVRVSGGNGNDSIRVAEAVAGEFTLPVTLLGGNGKDVLAGGSGADALDGGNGNDTLLGNGGDDELLGGNGKDRLEGGDGADRLDGGRGKDAVFGGAGADHFVGKKQEAEAQDEVAGEDLFDAAAGPKSKGKK